MWHFDSECIEDRGAYVRIAERIRDLTGGRLALSNLRDHVDLEAGTAWLAFSSGGQDYRWDLRVDDDWVDPAVFEKFDQVLGHQAPGLRLICCDLGGQDCLLLAGGTKRLERLRIETGLDFVWMNP